MLSTKVTILLLYRRIFSPHRVGIFDLSIRLFIVLLCTFYPATNFVKIWDYIPRQRIWDKSVPGRCVNVGALLNASGVFDTLTDIIILLTPVKAVWNLKTTYKNKIIIVLVFTVGFMYASIPS